MVDVTDASGLRIERLEEQARKLRAEVDRLRAERDALREALQKAVKRIKRSATALDWESIDQLEALLTPNTGNSWREASG